MRYLSLLLILLPAPQAFADTVVATRTLPAGSVITEGDMRMKADKSASKLKISEAVGRETRVTIYEGRPIRANQLIQPALIDRNQIVPLRYQSSGLQILTEGRALDRGAAGDVIRVLNTASRNTVSARVTPEGQLEVLGQ